MSSTMNWLHQVLWWFPSYPLSSQPVTFLKNSCFHFKCPVHLVESSTVHIWSFPFKVSVNCHEPIMSSTMNWLHQVPQTDYLSLHSFPFEISVKYLEPIMPSTMNWLHQVLWWFLSYPHSFQPITFLKNSCFHFKCPVHLVKSSTVHIWSFPFKVSVNCHEPIMSSTMNWTCQALWKGYILILLLLSPSSLPLQPEEHRCNTIYAWRMSFRAKLVSTSSSPGISAIGSIHWTYPYTFYLYVAETMTLYYWLISGSSTMYMCIHTHLFSLRLSIRS